MLLIGEVDYNKLLHQTGMCLSLATALTADFWMAGGDLSPMIQTQPLLQIQALPQIQAPTRKPLVMTFEGIFQDLPELAASADCTGWQSH